MIPPLYVTIVNQAKDFHSLHIDGESGKVYTFKWNPKHPQGGCYTYEPKSQSELDDIMRSQAVHEIMFFSVWVPGIFDKPKESKVEEPEPPNPFDSIPEAKAPDWMASPDSIEAQVKEMEDKVALSALIVQHGHQAPAKQSKLETFHAAAIEAILNSRIGENNAADSGDDLDI